MPFTPYHIGPGIAVKAVLQGSFSLVVFGWTQIVMDVQPLVVILTGSGQLHGLSHTMVGATVLGVGAAVSGKYTLDAGFGLLAGRGRSAGRMRWSVALLSAFIGSFSHLALDSTLYSDVTPWYPVSTSNQLFGLVPASDVQAFCVWSGVIGTVMYFVVAYALSRHNKRTAERQEVDC